MSEEKKRKNLENGFKGKRIKLDKGKNSFEYNGVKIPYPKSFQKSDEFGQQVYCICKKPDGGELMVGCDKCDGWYHFNCLKLNRNYEKLYYRFFCPYCQLNDPEKCQIIYKKKCLIDDCYLPINGLSKFCSKEHGLIYFGRIKNQVLKSSGGLQAGQIASILRMDGLDVKGFANIGNEFPSVSATEFDGFVEIENASSTYNVEMAELRQELQDTLDEQNYHKLRQTYLNILKDAIKKINEYFASLTGANGAVPKKTKKGSSSKKVEICGYNRKLVFSISSWKTYLRSQEARQVFDLSEADPDRLTGVKPGNSQAFDASTEELKKVFPTYESLAALQEDDFSLNIFPGTCLLEKKKCQKHAGWQKRITDESKVRLVELQNAVEEARQRITNLKHQYEVEYWESKEENFNGGNLVGIGAG